MTEDLTLEQFVRDFEAAEDATQEARKLAERDADYFHEKQWTAEEKAALEKRGQPAVTFNRIKRKINSLQGLEKQTRKDPKAFPRNPQDEDAARAATDALRYVCEDNRWDDKRSECALELAVQGTCAVMVGVKKVKGGYDPEIRRVAWDRFYYDPHSAEFDFEDAKFKGVVVWMDLDDAIATYPEAKDILESTWKTARETETYDDRPKYNLWADYKRRRVRLCEHYYRDGEGWKYCIFTKGGFVTEPMPSPYLGEDDQPECPIKAVSLYVDRDNNRYGEVRTMIGPQDEINKRRSKALHLINQRQVRVSPAVTDNPDSVRKELARPDGVFVGEAGDVEILPTNDMASANLNLLQEAKAEIDLLGPNAALAGKNEQQMSGRAIMAQQQGGMVESATYLDRIRVLSLSVYRSVWCRVKQFWKEERWVRVTDNEMNVRFVGLNKPVTALQQIAAQMGVDKGALPQIRQAADAGDPQAAQMLQQLQAMAQDPRAAQIVATENAVAELDVDIMVDEGIDTPTVQAEQFDTIVKMIPALGPLGQSPEVLKFVIEASSLKDKSKLLEIFAPKDGPPPPSPEEQAAQAMQAQMAMAQQQAEVEGQIEIEKAQIKAQSDIEVAKIKAGADAEIKQRQLEVDTALEVARYRSQEEAKAQVDAETGKADERKAAAQRDEVLAQTMQQLAQLMMDMNRPKTRVPVRDENGFIVAMREVMDDAA